MGNKPHSQKKSPSVKQRPKYDLKNPYKEGWLYKQSRHLRKWRKRWVVLQGHHIYTFTERRRYEHATETIDLRYFSSLSKETAYEDPAKSAQQTLAHFKRRFSSKKQHAHAHVHSHAGAISRSAAGEVATQTAADAGVAAPTPMYLILLSDLNNDETFVFKCLSQSNQTRWIYSIERAFEYKSNLLENIIPSEIIKYVVSLYFLSYERIQLSLISKFFYQLFSAAHYNCQYHYYQDAMYWSQHFPKLVKPIYDREQHTQKALRYDMEYGGDDGQPSVEQLQFNKVAFYLSSRDWVGFTRDDRLQLKYFFIFYHEFAALNYQKVRSDKSELSAYYVRHQSPAADDDVFANQHDGYQQQQRYVKHDADRTDSKHEEQHNGPIDLRSQQFVTIRDGIPRNESQTFVPLRYERARVREEEEEDGLDSLSPHSNVSRDDDDDRKTGVNHISDDILDELNKLNLKYEDIALDGHEWKDMFDRWISRHYSDALYVNCGISTLCFGADNFFDENTSIMTQLLNSAIDEHQIDSQRFYFQEPNFWNNGGIIWLCDILRYSYALSTHLCSIRVLSFRDSRFNDSHLKMFCAAINSRSYQSSQSLTISKLILSKNRGLSDRTMGILFTTIGNRLQYLESLELNQIGITDHMSRVLLDFYTDFHFNYDKVRLRCISLLGNALSVNALKIMNKLFEDGIIDENRLWAHGSKRPFELMVNASKEDAQRCMFDPRLKIVIANMRSLIQSLNR